MKLITRYITRLLLIHISIALLMLLSVNGLIHLLSGLKKTVAMTAIMQQALLQLPNDIYYWLPMATLLGSLWGLMTLASHKELEAIEGFGLYGFAVWRLLLPSFFLLLLFSLLCQEGFTRLTQPANKITPTMQQFWLHRQHPFSLTTLLAKTKTGPFQQVQHYQFNQAGNIKTITTAKQAVFSSHGLQLKHVKMVYLPQGKQVHQAALLLANYNKAELLSTRPMVSSSETLPVYRLFPLLQENHYSPLLRFMVWQCVLYPLTLFTMLLFPLLLTMNRSIALSPRWRPILILLLGFTLHWANQLAAALSQLAILPPLILALAPILMIFLFYTALCHCNRP